MNEFKKTTAPHVPRNPPVESKELGFLHRKHIHFPTNQHIFCCPTLLLLPKPLAFQEIIVFFIGNSRNTSTLAFPTFRASTVSRGIID